MATIDLATLNAAQGTTIFGADANDYSGRSVSNAGDVNGDGFDDLIIGAFLADAAGNLKSGAGESYVVFGGPSLPPTIDLANLGTAGFAVLGADAIDLSGSSVSSAGDVNGDGFDDLVIGARGADALGNTRSSAGECYVIFGGPALPATIDLSSLGAAGIAIYGAEENDYSGFSVSGAGDVNGDGFDDLILGANRAGGLSNAKPYSGESYVIFGSQALPETIDLTTLGTAGLAIFGAELSDRSGYSVSSAGDVNGDGFDDMLIGADFADALNNSRTSAGESYVVFGGPSLPASVDLANLGVAGFTIYGADSEDRSRVASGAGDVNGDGFDDLIIGAFLADASNNLKAGAGESYVVFGSGSLPPAIDLASLSTAGMTIFGAEEVDLSGNSVSGGGDINGDGFDDLIIGARGADGLGNSKSASGESYVIFGGASLPITLDLLNLGMAGITILGVEANDYSGFSVSMAGDVNGDGFDDVIIGADRADGPGIGKTNAGESYLIFGSDSFTSSVTLLGTDISESLPGTPNADVVVGGRGDDSLIGNGDADVLIGGQGDDLLSIGDMGFKRIVGGNGHDTLRLDGSGLSLDLTAIRDNRLLGIEAIDIAGTGVNTLTLTQREVLNLSDESNTLIVRRNAGDVVNMDGGWTQGSNITIDGLDFEVSTQGQATVMIQISSPAVINRQLFYNRSTSNVFGDGSGNPAQAIDFTKTALLPGQSSSFTNYSNYVRGLNGLIVDIADLPGIPTAADFQFATWDGMAAPGFVASLAVPTVSILPGGGMNGAGRVKIEFADSAIQNTWLRVTILAGANTGLSSNDVFYFGNAVADMDAGNTGSPITVRTNATDTSAVRQHQSISINSVGVTSIYDLNKDGRVNATDTAAVRQNQATSIIRNFTAPANLQLAIIATTSSSMLTSTPDVAMSVSSLASYQNYSRGESRSIETHEVPTTPTSSTVPLRVHAVHRNAGNHWKPSDHRALTREPTALERACIKRVDQYFADNSDAINFGS